MRKVVVIEDEDALRETIADFLEIEGYEVHVAENGFLGIQLIEKVMPDVILCDVMMPRMDGYEVLNKVKNNPKLVHIPFILLTARSERQDMRKGMTLGADDYITKPFEFQEIIESIETRINKALKSPVMEDIQIDDLKKRLEEQAEKIKNYAFVSSHQVRHSLVNLMGLLAKFEDDSDSHSISQYLEKHLSDLEESIKVLNDTVTDYGDTELKEEVQTEIKEVFLVDDDRFQNVLNANVVKKVIKGVHLTAFDQAQQALQALKKGQFPDVIFLDINMPVMNGFAFLDAIQEIHGLEEQVDVFMLTSSIDYADKAKSFSYPIVKGFINKPLSKDILSKVLKTK